MTGDKTRTKLISCHNKHKNKMAYKHSEMQFEMQLKWKFVTVCEDLGRYFVYCLAVSY